MNGRIVNMAAFREKRQRSELEEALGMLYWGVLQSMQDENGDIDPEELEEFFARIIVDYLMANFEGLEDLGILADDYNRFENRLRQTLFRRLSDISRQD